MGSFNERGQCYITSAGSTFSYDAELAEVSNDTATLTGPEITNHEARGFIQTSIKAWMDQPNFGGAVAKIIADGGLGSKGPSSLQAQVRLETSEGITNSSAALILY